MAQSLALISPLKALGEGPMVELLEFRTKIEDLGLTYKTVQNHASKLFEKSIADNPHIPVQDTCRLDNGGIIKLPERSQSQMTQHSPNIAAFVPAAGAASRYFKNLAKLRQALENTDTIELDAARDFLVTLGAISWPLPTILKHWLDAEDSSTRSIFAENRQQILSSLNLPKALQPCVAEGMTFFEVKLKEHDSLKTHLSHQIFIVPPDHGDLFRKALEHHPCQLPTSFFEQGPKLSTLRFLPNGMPFTDDHGNLSLVPAGHGALALLFPEVNKLGENIKGIFIRNVDNIMGTSTDVRQISASFLGLFHDCQQAMETIRQGLKHGADINSAVQVLESLLTSTPARGSVEQRLWHIQEQLFHCSPQQKISLEQLYQRPLNILGMVPNTQADVGGTPCFVDIADATAKICLEVPHASPKDKDTYFTNADKATHFNPVFCACEPTSNKDYYHADDSPFWLKANKTFQGIEVCYHETVLYELIGNSTLANVIFVEVPRKVFNPHKSLADGANKSISSWLNGS